MIKCYFYRYGIYYGGKFTASLLSTTVQWFTKSLSHLHVYTYIVPYRKYPDNRYYYDIS